MSELAVFNTLSSDAFVQLNKHIIKHLDGNLAAAVLLAELISKYKYFKSNDMLDDYGQFYYTGPSILKELGIKRATLNNAIKHLEAFCLIEITYKGYPKVRYFRLNFRQIHKVLMGSKPKKKKVDKDGFYDSLNSAKTLEEFMKVTDHIPEEIAKSMWLLQQKIGGRPAWDSISYGKLRNFLKYIFRGKRWDYTVFTRLPKIDSFDMYKVIDELRGVEVLNNEITFEECL